MIQSLSEMIKAEVEKWEWKLKHRDEVLKVWLVKSILFTAACDVLDDLTFACLCSLISCNLSSHFLCSSHTGCFFLWMDCLDFNVFACTFSLPGMFFSKSGSFSFQFKSPLRSFLITSFKPPSLISSFFFAIVIVCTHLVLKNVFACHLPLECWFHDRRDFIIFTAVFSYLASTWHLTRFEIGLKSSELEESSKSKVFSLSICTIDQNRKT